MALEYVFIIKVYVFVKREFWVLIKPLKEFNRELDFSIFIYITKNLSIKFNIK